MEAASGASGEERPVTSVAQRIREHARLVAYGLAAMRIGNGCVLLLSPGLAARLYLGPGGAEPVARVLARFVGARDVLTGGAAVAALLTERNDVEAVATAAVIEGADAGISIVSRGSGWKLRGASVTAIAAAWFGGLAAQGLAAERRVRSAG
jgi:hypothetical protein